MYNIEIKTLTTEEDMASLYRFKQFYSMKSRDIDNMHLEKTGCIWFGLWLNGKLDAISSACPLPHINLKAVLLNWQSIRARRKLPNGGMRKNASKPFNYVLNNFIPRQTNYMMIKGYSEFYLQHGSDDLYDADDWMIWLGEHDLIRLSYSHVLYKGKKRNFYRLDLPRFFTLAKRIGQ